MKKTTTMPLRASLMAASGLVIGVPAHAQERAQAQPLQTVVVSASRSQTKVEEMPLHTTIVSHEDIQKSPARTLDQLLRNVPGMNFTAVPAALSDPTSHQTKMRGLGNAKVLVLLDGVPIHDPFFLTTQWFKVPLSNIERVEIIRGGNSSLWGNMAVAGVVNIVSKRVQDNAGQVIASGGSHGTGSISVSKNFAVSDALGFSLSADVYHTDGYQTTPAAFLYRFPQKRPVSAENRNIQLTTYFKPGADLNGYLRLGYHVQDQEISYRFGRNLQESPDIAAQLEKKISTASSMQANVWGQYVRFDKLNGNTCYYQGGSTCLTSSSPTLTPERVNDNVVQFYTQQGALRYRERGGSLIYSTRLRSPLYSVQAGVDYRRLSAEDTELFFSTPVSPDEPQGRYDSSTFGKGRQTFQGLFAQAKFAPVDRLDVTASARLDRYEIDQRTNTRTTAAGATTGGALPEASKTAFNPSLAARYDIDDALSVRAAAYKAFRAPGFNNLTRTFGTGTNTTIANPDLVPENLRGWEVGSDYRNGAFSLGATYFFYDIKNMIATFTASGASAPQQVQLICGGPALPNCGGSARYYTNDQDGESHGVEVVAQWRYGDHLKFDGYYTRTESHLTRRGPVVTDPIGVQLVGVPKDVAKVGVTYKPSRKAQTYVELRYTGPMLLDTTSKQGMTRFGQRSNTVINASANYAWSDSIDLFATVSNLLDREYGESTYSVNQPYNQVLSSPRTVNAGLRVRF